MKKSLKVLSLFGMLAMVLGVSITVTSCGGDGTTTQKPSNPETTTQEGGEGGESETTSIADPLADLEQDIELEDGEILYDDVQIKMWTIVGSPDDIVFKKLITEFNKEYRGYITINVVQQGHYDYYPALETTWVNDPESAPDVCFMHNEKTTQYAFKGYLYPLDSFIDRYNSYNTENTIDTSLIYQNIDRVTKYKGVRYALPVDAHGFLTSFRQDIIKKNGLGFDENTRFIPESREEYNTLLQRLRDKADSPEGIQIRNVNKGANHAWKTVKGTQFYPEYMQSTDPDGLGALYANGGTLTDESQETITFHENEGFQTYITDQVNRYNNKLMYNPGTNTECFGLGTIAMFNEGPWWIGQTYEPAFNNIELRTVGNGVTQEDVDDPIISHPFTASHTKSWWTLDENVGTENGSKWYGNGHAMSITKHCTSLTKAMAIMKFMQWYTQHTREDGSSVLADWADGGHMPAWKNIYESQYYQNKLDANSEEYNVTLAALGNPEDIIAMEGLEYETTIFNGLASSIEAVHNQLQTSAGCTVAQAIELLNETAQSVQDALDELKEEW